MKTFHDDCWLPTPGSWEEAVDPYDVQCTRQQPLSVVQEQGDVPTMDMLQDSQPKKPLLTSAV
ncbi:MAG TPA: hypothetical protein VHV83_15570 [Armatimonadota bacterium]|nr:hypothetical protein [Armatimonadota bacterium]